MRDISWTSSPNAVGEVPGRSGRALVFVSTLDDLATVADHQRAADEPPRSGAWRCCRAGRMTGRIRRLAQLMS